MTKINNETASKEYGTVTIKGQVYLVAHCYGFCEPGKQNQFHKIYAKTVPELEEKIFRYNSEMEQLRVAAYQQAANFEELCMLYEREYQKEEERILCLVLLPYIKKHLTGLPKEKEYIEFFLQYVIPGRLIETSQIYCDFIDRICRRNAKYGLGYYFPYTKICDLIQNETIPYIYTHEDYLALLVELDRVKNKKYAYPHIRFVLPYLIHTPAYSMEEIYHATWSSLFVENETVKIRIHSDCKRYGLQIGDNILTIPDPVFERLIAYTKNRYDIELSKENIRSLPQDDFIMQSRRYTDFTRLLRKILFRANLPDRILPRSFVEAMRNVT